MGLHFLCEGGFLYCKAHDVYDMFDLLVTTPPGRVVTITLSAGGRVGEESYPLLQQNSQDSQDSASTANSNNPQHRINRELNAQTNLDNNVQKQSTSTRKKNGR